MPERAETPADRPHDQPPAPATSLPRCPPPAKAWDCHAHIYGPLDRFPLQADATYMPPYAPSTLYIAMLDRMGMRYGVLVQAVPYGTDNSAVLDGLRRFPGRLRGIALARSDASPRELQDMRDAGVRGLRFSQTRAPLGAARGRVGMDELKAMAPVMRELGWHAQLFMRVDDFVDVAEDLLKLRIPLVLDHMGGRYLAAHGPQADYYQRMLGLLRHEDIWVKMTPHRSSKLLPDHADVRPHHDALLATRPDRLIWGSDWPYVWLDPAPDAGHLVDLFMRWTPDAALRQRILVDNPAHLYGLPDIQQG